MCARASVLVLLAVCVAATSALECYECSGCKEGERHNPIECSSRHDACGKVVLGTRVEKSCVHNTACNLVDAAKKDLYGLVNDYISDFGNTFDEMNFVVHCCQSDYCNGGSALGPATAALLLAPLLLSALLR